MSRPEELIQVLCPNGVEYKELQSILKIKKWKYVLIPSTKITQNSTFKNLVEQYTMED